MMNKKINDCMKCHGLHTLYSVNLQRFLKVLGKNTILYNVQQVSRNMVDPQQNP